MLKTCCSKLLSSCSNPDKVEILFKVDSLKAKRNVKRIFKHTPFKIHILLNGLKGYMNTPSFANDLCKMSSGCLLFMFADDCVITGDWYSRFMETRDMFEDNIYAINARPNIGWSITPVISREWFDVLGEVCPVPSADCWVRDLANGIGRHVTAKGVNVIHNKIRPDRYNTKEIKWCRDRIKRLFPREPIDWYFRKNNYGRVRRLVLKIKPEAKRIEISNRTSRAFKQKRTMARINKIMNREKPSAIKKLLDAIREYSQ